MRVSSSRSSSRRSPRSPVLPQQRCSMPPASRRDQPAAISLGCWAQKHLQHSSAHAAGLDASRTSGAVVPGGARPRLPAPEPRSLTAELLQAGMATGPRLSSARGKGLGSSKVNPEAAADPHGTCRWQLRGPFACPCPRSSHPSTPSPRQPHAEAGPGAQNSLLLGSRWSRQQEPHAWSSLVSSLLLRP